MDPNFWENISDYGIMHYLHYYAENGDLKNVKLCEAKNPLGLWHTWKKPYGYTLSGTPLIEASRNGHVKVVEYILSKHLGQDIINCLNKALLVACENGHENIVQKLINAGATIEYKNGYGAWCLYERFPLTIRDLETKVQKFIIEYREMEKEKKILFF